MFWFNHEEPNLPTLNDKEQLRILLVDDDQFATAPLVELANQMGIDAHVTFDPREAIEEMASQKYDLIVIDWRMPHLTGEEALRLAQETLLAKTKKRRFPKVTPYVVYTGVELSQMRFYDTHNFHMMDWWKKGGSMKDLITKARSTFQGL